MPAVAIKDSSAATTSVASYNGFTFPVLRQVSVKGQPVFDPSRRALMYTLYRADIYFWLYANSEATLSTGLDGIKNILTQPGGTLILEGFGLGNITVSGTGAGPQQDVMWGPTPGELRLGTLGGNVATEGWWSCEWAGNDCLSSGTSPRGLITAFNYDAIFATDDRGLSTRVFTGQLQIANSKRTSADRSVTITADDKWSSVVLPVPPGYSRTSQQRKLDASRLRLDFTIVDTEIAADDALPPGITRGSLVFAVENGDEMNFQQWEFSVSATMERLKGTDRSLAYQKWFQILDGTVSAMVNQLGTKNADAVVPLRVRIENDKWGLETRFFASFRIFRAIDDIFTFTQLWAPVPGADYNLWAQSMQLAWYGGLQQQKFYANQDAIVDLCHQSLPSPSLNTGSQAGYTQPVSYISCDNITETSSWLTYENRLVSETNDRTSYHQPVQSYTPADLTDQDITAVDGDPVLATLTANKQSTLQYHGVPGMTVCMKGKAARIKFKPMPPKLATIGGYKVRRTKQKIDGPRLLGYNGPCPIYGISWEVCYKLTDVPAGDTVQSRPESGPQEDIVGGDV